MSDETKPCPFCGSGNLILGHGNQVLCCDCGGEGPTVPRGTARDAFSATKVARWNRRAPAPTIADQHRRMLELLRGISHDNCLCFLNSPRGEKCWECRRRAIVAEIDGATPVKP